MSSLRDTGATLNRTPSHRSLRSLRDSPHRHGESLFLGCPGFDPLANRVQLFHCELSGVTPGSLYDNDDTRFGSPRVTALLVPDHRKDGEDEHCHSG